MAAISTVRKEISNDTKRLLFYLRTHNEIIFIVGKMTISLLCYKCHLQIEVTVSLLIAKYIIFDDNLNLSA